ARSGCGQKGRELDGYSAQRIFSGCRRGPLHENLERGAWRGADVLETVRGALFHEERLPRRRGHRRVGANCDLQTSLDGNPQVILDIVVRMDPSCGAGLNVDTRHPDL